MRVLFILFLIPLLTHAGNEDGSNCSAYNGLDVCNSTFGLDDEQISFSEQNADTFVTKMEEHHSLFDTSLTDEDMNQMQKENAFKNIDSFRAYMKTLENPDRTGNGSEFSIKKKIIDSTNFGLDCRLVADSIYEVPDSPYYDCALQRYF